tara:strand:- start:123 stop:395 length:273 start_codon:yes stop_codon:yes gene_type:complete
MEFKRFKRKGLIFNNNSIGLGLEVRMVKKIKVFRIERSDSEKAGIFKYSIFDGAKIVEGSIKKEIVNFLEINDTKHSFFDGEVKVWEKIS